MKNLKKFYLPLIFILGYFLLFFSIQANLLSRQYRGLIILALVNIMLALSLNLVVGFLGELSLGHAAFMMSGAYVSAIFTNGLTQLEIQLPPVIVVILACALGGVIAAIFGLLIGLPTLRLSGDYVAIVTLAFGEILRSIIENLKITQGSQGLNVSNTLTTYKHFSYAYLAMVLTILLIIHLIDSRSGRAIIAARENKIAAASIGINVAKYKLIAFVLAAAIAGVAGTIYAHDQGSIFPVKVGYNESINILVMVVMGGMGNILGSIIAAIVLTILPELLRDAQEFRQLVYALALIIIMLSRQKGWQGKISLFKSLKKKGD